MTVAMLIGGFVVLVALIAALRLRGGTPPGLRQPGAPSKIELIKRYREQHGVSLKEAKEAVEAGLLPAPASSPARVQAAPALDLEAVRALVRAGQQLEAIKLYRSMTGSNLRESKDAVDALRAEQTRPGV